MNIKVIDDYLKTDDFNDLTSLKLNPVENNGIRIYHNKINSEKIISNNCISSDLLKRLQDNYHSGAIKLLRELNPKKVNLYDYSEFQIIETGANYKFPIHDDTPDKLLSGVVYLKPLKNIGTIFYADKKGNGKSTIDWKVNRGIFFSRSERNTWHSYESDGNSNRIVLVYNLMTERIRDVYKVERKNYFLGQLRYKVNPYLYKFFRFTI